MCAWAHLHVGTFLPPPPPPVLNLPSGDFSRGAVCRCPCDRIRCSQASFLRYEALVRDAGAKYENAIVDLHQEAFSDFRKLSLKSTPLLVDSVVGNRGFVVSLLRRWLNLLFVTRSKSLTNLAVC